MSVAIESNTHIDALIGFLVTTRGGDATLYAYPREGLTMFKLFEREHLDSIGRILIEANERAYAEKYSHHGEEINAERIESYEWNPAGESYMIDLGPKAAVTALKLAGCLEYQCCEMEDWVGSPAHAILEALRKRAIRKLPGYEDAPWGLREFPEGSGAISLMTLAGEKR